MIARGNARQRIFLDDGDRKSFIDNLDRVLDHIDGQALSPEIVRKDRPAHSLDVIAERNQEREAAIQEAYSTGAYTISEIAEFFDMHRSMASRIARQ